MKETLADGFTSYIDPLIDEKSIVMVSLVGVYCLEPKCMCVCNHGRTCSKLIILGLIMAIHECTVCE